ncbi:hypothetical protein KY290_031209 [Solanum tuberosum]|uniref:Uncharacterized protein n=1 Tax=Solanum tuberosum TaxID=4113 RepID=A0ABQ7U8G7_SOLTU|nr:hypothetical protein KY290_031209 [Solanum tuberosum]
MEDLIQKNESLLPDKKDTLTYVHPNEKKLPHTSELHTEKQDPNNYSNHGEKDASNFTKTEDFQKLSQEVSMICKELKAFEDKVDGQFADMKKFMCASFLKILEEIVENVKVVFDVHTRENDDVNDVPINEAIIDSLHDNNIYENAMVDTSHVSRKLKTSSHETPTFVDFDEPPLMESQLIALEPEATHVTPIKQVCKKALGKYAQSPYNDLIDSCGTSENRPVYFSIKHPFVNCNIFYVDMNLTKAFEEWYNDKLSKKRDRKASIFTIAKNVIKPPFEF